MCLYIGVDTIECFDVPICKESRFVLTLGHPYKLFEPILNAEQQTDDQPQKEATNPFAL